VEKREACRACRNANAEGIGEFRRIKEDDIASLSNPASFAERGSHSIAAVKRARKREREKKRKRNSLSLSLSLSTNERTTERDLVASCAVVVIKLQ
jgi:hypothetical protein